MLYFGKRIISSGTVCNTKINNLYNVFEGDFEISENDNVCCIGKAHAPINDCLLLQSRLHEITTQMMEDEIILSRDSIYRDFRVRGYDYNKEFRKLCKIKTKDFNTLMGECEWNGNIVAYLDNLLQAQILITPFRKLMVPVMVKSIRIDPKILFENVKQNRVYCNDSVKDNGIYENGDNDADKDDDVGYEKLEEKFQNQFNERFCLYESLIKFCLDVESKLLIAPGVEIEDMLAFPIPRKMPTSLVLDSYEWVANDDNNAMNECESNSIKEYIEVCFQVD